jgi:hypothetical protein
MAPPLRIKWHLQRNAALKKKLHFTKTGPKLQDLLINVMDCVLTGRPILVAGQLEVLLCSQKQIGW